MTTKYRLHPFFEESYESQKRLCDNADCPQEGLYKAPKNAGSLNNYYWFCLEHVREYNARWNYYKDKNAHEVEYLNRDDVTWQRPTWPFGMNPQDRFRSFSFYDPHDILGYGTNFSPFNENTDQTPYYSSHSAEGKAIALFDITLPLDIKMIKARYLELVKKYHPDRNGGCKVAEEKLKTINQAFEVLKRVFAA